MRKWLYSYCLKPLNSAVPFAMPSPVQEAQRRPWRKLTRRGSQCFLWSFEVATPTVNHCDIKVMTINDHLFKSTIKWSTICWQFSHFHAVALVAIDPWGECVGRFKRIAELQALSRGEPAKARDPCCYSIRSLGNRKTLRMMRNATMQTEGYRWTLRLPSVDTPKLNKRLK